MLTKVLKRVGSSVVTLVVVSIVVFLGTQILPGDSAEIILGQSADEASVEALRRELGLDRPAAERYLRWLAAFLSGDLGVSAMGNVAITSLIAERLGNTLLLAALVASVTIPTTLLLGVLAAMNPGTWFDRIVGNTTMMLVAVPEFLIATILILVFAVQIRLFPPIAYMSGNESLAGTLWTLTLPVLTLSFFIGAQIVRMTRAALLNVLSSDFIEMTILKGMPRRRIVLRHALPNAIGPIASVLALALAYLVSGVVVVESVFAYPGIAKLMVEAVQTRDLVLVQTCAMIFCTAYVVLLTLADVIQIVSNPRLRHGG